MTPQEAKDLAALAYGFVNFRDFESNLEIGSSKAHSFEDGIINRALDIMWNAAIDAAAAAEEHFGFGNEELISKQSILKLKR